MRQEAGNLPSVFPGEDEYHPDDWCSYVQLSNLTDLLDRRERVYILSGSGATPLEVGMDNVALIDEFLACANQVIPVSHVWYCGEMYAWRPNCMELSGVENIYDSPESVLFAAITELDRLYDVGD